MYTINTLSTVFITISYNFLNLLQVSDRLEPQDGAHLSEGCLKGYEVKLEHAVDVHVI